MKNFLTLSILVLTTMVSFDASAQKAKKLNLKIQTSDQSAKIIVNGSPAGNGFTTVKVFPNQSISIDTDLPGLYSENLSFVNNGYTKIPKTVFIKLLVDEAYLGSVATDIANVDVNLVPKKSQTDTWRAINSVVLQYIDAIEVSDKDNFYLRTAWVVVPEGSGTYRTRVIIKANGDSNFSIKVVSEKGPRGIGIKEDEKFVPWDRVFKKYSNLVSEIQNRI